MTKSKLAEPSLPVLTQRNCSNSNGVQAAEHRGLTSGIAFTEDGPGGKVLSMNYSFLTLAITAVALAGCASPSKSTTPASSNAPQPWLCQGVDGAWQCQRGGASAKVEQADIATAKHSAAEQASPIPTASAANNLPNSLNTPSQPQPNPEPEPEPEPEPDKASWTIQWIALASETATRAFAATLFAGLQVDYDIEQIQVGSRRFFILFSGRYPTKALAAQAATQMPLASSEKPYLRTLASIAAVRVD